MSNNATKDSHLFNFMLMYNIFLITSQIKLWN